MVWLHPPAQHLHYPKRFRKLQSHWRSAPHSGSAKPEAREVGGGERRGTYGMGLSKEQVKHGRNFFFPKLAEYPEW